jgi:hypothetical protein
VELDILADYVISTTDDATSVKEAQNIAAGLFALILHAISAREIKLELKKSGL